MNKKRNTIITIIIITCIFLAGAIFYLLTFSKDESSLTVLEKKWISDNINKVIDIDVYNDIPVFGYNGEGMIFDFLDYTTKENQINFEKEFSYAETPDQIKVTEEIKKDMESNHPMDRLLCGDVGYGKTEVAFRAAFKAILSGKQVAMLCPTTILSNQHYLNALERFKSFPVNIKLLNRFTTNKEADLIMKANLELGRLENEI